MAVQRVISTALVRTWDIPRLKNGPCFMIFPPLCSGSPELCRLPHPKLITHFTYLPSFHCQVFHGFLLSAGRDAGDAFKQEE
jgi:hypothetical protein